MSVNEKCYIAIDLKSFYASVECIERGLDPLDALLVVADAERTSKTICLAVSPSLKAYGIGGRPRLFEVEERVRNINAGRRYDSQPSRSASELAKDSGRAIDYIVAKPRMALYIEYSTRIYEVYLRYIAPEDIHVYSIDEVFIDATEYLGLYGMTAHELAMQLIREVLSETGVTATAGIGTNLYLCKVAMDIEAKKMAPDADGVRIAELDESSYRERLWNHEPLTDFWRVGRATAERLERYGVRTMGDLARFSVKHQEFLYKLFGVNAELLIDHAFGIEPVTIAHIKAYRPETHSLSSGQVLQRPYSTKEARNVIIEMADSMALDLVEKGLVTAQIVLDIGYDSSSLATAQELDSAIDTDRYGRSVPRHAHGSHRMAIATSSGRAITEAACEIFDRKVNPLLTIRRINLTAAQVSEASEEMEKPNSIQLDLFTDPEEQLNALRAYREQAVKERLSQDAVIRIQQRFGKNAILKGFNFGEGTTQRSRNEQIGGHKA